MSREDGGTTLYGIEVSITRKDENETKETIEYFNRQLGKYSDGKGGCDVAICYECFIDATFGWGIRKSL